MTVLRWSVYDPLDTNEGTNHWDFPRNPSTMSSPYPERAIQSMSSTRGTTLFTEGGSPAKSFEFSGPILDKTHFDMLELWTYHKPGRLLINDHYGRKIRCMWTALDVVPKRRINYYYSHDYTVRALVFAVTPPTIANEGPL